MVEQKQFEFKDEHTEVIEKPTLICKECEGEVCKCQDCDEYFEKGDKIVCAVDSYHYCEQCFEDMREEPENLGA